MNKSILNEAFRPLETIYSQNVAQYIFDISVFFFFPLNVCIFSNNNILRIRIGADSMNNNNNKATQRVTNNVF